MLLYWQAENNTLTEALTRQKAEVTVLTQKRARVEQALEQQEKQSKALKVAAQRLQVSTQSLGLRSKHGKAGLECSDAMLAEELL